MEAQSAGRGLDLAEYRQAGDSFLYYTVCPRKSDQFYLVSNMGRFFLDMQYLFHTVSFNYSWASDPATLNTKYRHYLTLDNTTYYQKRMISFVIETR